MSAIAGMIDWRGGHVGPAVRKAVAVLHLHGRDGEGIWDGDDVALGWRQTVLHAEDRADSQPLTGGGGRFKLVFDGRLDNRDELARLLTLAPERARALPDASYALAAFEKWGADCAKHLLGDFAFAAWDAGKRALFLARDHMGVRPLVYHCGAHFFAFATHPDALFSHPEIPLRIGEATIVRQLLMRHFEPGRTFFDDVLRVPAGHVMTVTAAAVHLRAYWRLEDTAPIAFASDDEYVEAFRERFTEAVRCRLRSIHPVGSHLSGGLDSTSITAVAAGLLADKGRRLRAYTSVPRKDWVPVYEVPGQISNEGPLAAAVAARHPNIDHVLSEGPGIWDFAAHDRFAKSFAAPMMSCHNAGWLNLLHDTARAQGVRVMLTGGMGNLTISYDGRERLASLLRRGRLLALAGEWRAAHAQAVSHKSLLRLSVLPLLPKELGNRLLAMLGRPLGSSADFSVLSTALRPLAASIERTGTLPHPLTRRTILERLSHRGLEIPLGHQLAAWDIDARNPATDKRIVAFCYAIPDDQFFRHGQSRRLVRRAMSGLLPDAVLAGKGRGRQAADWCEAAVKAKPELLAEVDRLAVTERLASVLDIAKTRNVILALNPDAAARDPHFAPRANHALLAVTVGRFVRRTLAGTPLVPDADLAN